MSVTSGFFNSVNGDRKYDAQQMSSIFDGIINDGVFASIGTAFSVQATTGNTVTVGTGRAWFDHAWLLNDSTLPIELDDAEVLLDRIDAIVIEINHSETVRAGSIKVINGTPSSTPTNPTMTHTDYINQYPIAYIMRSANSNAITQANITYMVGSDACPFITGLLSVVSIQNIVAQWESEFDTWLDSLSAMLDDNTAANLANQILELKEQFDTLAREKKIYSELEDSTGDDTIDDSTGNPILGTTSMYSDDGQHEMIPGATTSGDPYKVGDVLTTARTDLGAKWLLCNGDTLDRDLYPELATLFPYSGDITGEWTAKGIGELVSASGSTDNPTIADMIYVNGIYILCGYTVGNSKNVPFVATASSLNETFTIYHLTDESSIDLRAEYISYENGYYIVTDTHSKRLYYALAPAGPWSVMDFSSASPSIDNMTNVIYVDGYYYFVTSTRTHDSGTYTIKNKWRCYRSHILSGSWESKDIYDDGLLNPDNAYASKLTYLNEYFTVSYAEVRLENSAMGETAACECTLLYTAVPWSSGAWSSAQIWSDTSQGLNNSIADGLLYLNGYYYLMGRKQTTSGTLVSYLCYSASLSGPWSMRTVMTSAAVTSAYNTDTEIIFAGNTFAGAISSPSAEAITKTFSSGELTDGIARSQEINVIRNFNGPYIIGGSRPTAVLSGPWQAMIASSDSNEISLPSVSLSDKLYTYIRAKE